METNDQEEQSTSWLNNVSAALWTNRLDEKEKGESGRRRKRRLKVGKGETAWKMLPADRSLLVTH